MVGYFFLGLALLVGGVLGLRWLTTADPGTLARAVKWIGALAIAALVVFLAVTGRFGWAIGAAMALLPWFLRFRLAARMAKNYARAAGGAPSGRTSDVETRFVRMTLDHDSGDLDGEVVDGPFAGRRLSGMPLGDLVALLQHCWTEDSQSAQVLESYLDRAHPEWREQARAGAADGGGGAGPGTGAMTADEAYRVLGLEPGADEAEIKAAYHRLIAGLHPDKGGSTYLAAQINEAKRVLLGS